MVEVVRLPRGALLVTVGAAGSGKTTFLERHVPSGVIVSADRIRYELAGDAAVQELDRRVWGTLFGRVHARLARGLLTAVDSTAASPKTRRALREIAALYDAPLVYVVFATPLVECLQRNAQRRDPLRSVSVPPAVVRHQFARLAAVVDDPTRLRGARVIVIRPDLAEGFALEMPTDCISRAGKPDQA
jgi:predicted kinase